MKAELGLLFAGFSLERPLGLVALVLPLVVWIWARRDAAPHPIATGTLAIWQLVAQRDPGSGRRRRARASPALWCALAALVSGALALAGPRLSVAPAARTWRIHVDRRPAMFLRDAPSTRLDQGLATARRWLADVRRPGDELVWIDASREAARPGAPAVRGAEPPEEWRRAPRIPLPAPDWLACDEPDALWITDREPALVPRHAVLVLAGGSAVPGPIDTSGTTRWDWDGERIVEVPRGAAERRVAIEGALARPLRGILEAWASARALAIDPQATSDIALRIRSLGGAGGAAVSAGRDGWRARGTILGAAPAEDEDGGLETWLAVELGPETRALVTRAPGRVWSAWSSMDAPQGDPAAFAVSMASLFDGCVLPAQGVVALRERLAAGTAEVRPPRGASPAADGTEAPALSDSGARLDTWFAAFSLLAALAALALVFVRQRSVRRGGVAPARSIG